VADPNAKTEPVEIELKKRAADWHACIAGQPEIWGCGPTPKAAIGDLVWSHMDRFGVCVTWHGRETANV